MFGIQFYPTPPELARKMIEPYVEHCGLKYNVLDPSAGSGNLLQTVIDLCLGEHAGSK